ncbi:MAG TPA: hypothetical protein VGQ83_33550 [Polyangia bacterium]|jgi:hypothetical protein
MAKRNHDGGQTPVAEKRLRAILRFSLGLAAAAMIAACVWLVLQVRRTPDRPPPREQTSDVVVPPPPPLERAYPRPGPAEAGSQPAVVPIPPERQLKPVVRILPKDLRDPSRPPMYTKPLAAPPANPTPPNPFNPPPLQMNPERDKPPY